MKNMIVLADGFEEIEAVSVIDILRRLQIPLTVVGLDKKCVTGAHGLVITCDEQLSAIHADEITGVILPGGLPGAYHLRDGIALLAMIRELDKRGALCAAICAAPIALATAGILKNRRYTCYPGFENEIPVEARGTYVANENVVCDGHVLTAAGPAFSAAFAFAIGTYFKYNAQVSDVQAGMLFNR